MRRGPFARASECVDCHTMQESQHGQIQPVATHQGVATGMSVANKTQRSDPGQAHDRRQHGSYGKVVSQRQEGFVSHA